MTNDKNSKSSQTPSIKLVFDKNVPLAYLYKKTEKLTAAVYLVTGFIKDEDHLKWQLRKKGIELLSEILSASHTHPVDKRQGRRIAGCLAELISLFEIGAMSKVISEMNFRILKSEVLALLLVLEEEVFVDTFDILMFPSEYFDIKKDAIKTDLGVGEEGSFSSKGQDMSFRNYSGKSPFTTNVSTKIAGDFIKDIVKKAPSSAASSGLTGMVKMPASDRRKEIISLIKVKKEIAVTDLSEVIKDCSEKTLQRELISMVKDNVLRKTGDRRWSRYSLI